jgi:hypothetical protein
MSVIRLEQKVQARKGKNGHTGPSQVVKPLISFRLLDGMASAIFINWSISVAREIVSANLVAAINPWFEDAIDQFENDKSFTHFVLVNAVISGSRTEGQPGLLLPLLSSCLNQGNGHCVISDSAGKERIAIFSRITFERLREQGHFNDAGSPPL